MRAVDPSRGSRARPFRPPRYARARDSGAPAAPPLITLDTHADIPLDFATRAVDPLNANLQVNLEKMARGGLDAAFFIVYVGQTPRNDANQRQAQADAQTKFAAIHRMADELYPSRIEIAYRADDVERIAGRGKLVAAIGIENGYVLGKSLDLLDRGPVPPQFRESASQPFTHTTCFSFATTCTRSRCWSMTCSIGL